MMGSTEVKNMKISICEAHFGRQKDTGKREKKVPSIQMPLTEHNRIQKDFTTDLSER